MTSLTVDNLKGGKWLCNSTYTPRSAKQKLQQKGKDESDRNSKEGADDISVLEHDVLDSPLSLSLISRPIPGVCQACTPDTHTLANDGGSSHSDARVAPKCRVARRFVVGLSVLQAWTLSRGSEVRALGDHQGGGALTHRSLTCVIRGRVSPSPPPGAGASYKYIPWSPTS